MTNQAQGTDTIAPVFADAAADDAADEAFGIDAMELQRRRMYLTAILEADPDEAF
jgi:hypothetical protein